MIEDYQTEYSPKGSQTKKRERKSRFVLFVLCFLAWCLLVFLAYCLFYRSISDNLVNTNAIEIIKNRKELRKEINTEDHTLCFAVLTTGTPVFKTYKTKVQASGSTAYHTALEGLLTGPDLEAVSEGAVSLIDSSTKLEGFALSGNTCFISLSDDFLNSEDLEGAKTQVKTTLKSENPSISEFVFLVDKKEI